MYTKKMHDIQYSFLVGSDGNVYEGRGWEYATNLHKHTKENEKSIFICLLGAFRGSGDIGMSLTVVSRDDWNARKPKHSHPLTHPVGHVVCSFTKTQPCFSLVSCKHFVKRFQKYHQAVKKKLDIAYNFLVSFDGTAFEGRGWHTHTEIKYYLPKQSPVRDGIHIALIGDFHESNPPPERMYVTLHLLIDFGVRNNFIAMDYELHTT